jgi:hypothetical protein
VAADVQDRSQSVRLGFWGRRAEEALTVAADVQDRSQSVRP